MSAWLHHLLIRPSARNRNWIKNGLFTVGVCRAGHGLVFTAYSLMHDMHELGTVVTTWTPFLLLGVALLIALGFEFVNGFHDTANAVATVIYTNSLPPQFAVVWSGFSISSGCCCPAARWRSASSPCCRWS
jgi:hypothetical protein